MAAGDAKAGGFALIGLRRYHDARPITCAICAPEPCLLYGTPTTKSLSVMSVRYFDCPHCRNEQRCRNLPER